MSKNETSSSSKAPAKGKAAASGPATERSDWDRKLREARAKREQVLSARALADSSQQRKTLKTPKRKHKPTPQPSPGNTLKPEAKVTTSFAETMRLGFNRKGSNALNALLVFCGATGFGLGIALGFGLLMGLGASSNAVDASGADAALTTETPDLGAQHAAATSRQVDAKELTSAKTDAETPTLSRDQEVLFAVSGVIEPEAIPFKAEIEAVTLQDSKIASPILVSVSDLPDMLDKDISFFMEADSQFSLPEISTVKYMRDDIAETEAAGLRSLPIVPAKLDEESQSVVPEVREPSYFMHAPDGIPEAQIRRYVSDLKATGVAISGIGREGFRVSTTHLRYYSPETAEAAQAVARDLGVEARDFSQNAQNSARIEVWVAGRPKPDETEKQTSRGVFYWLGQGRREER